jgi:hypothetical protein
MYIRANKQDRFFRAKARSRASERDGHPARLFLRRDKIYKERTLARMIKAAAGKRQPGKYTFLIKLRREALLSKLGVSVITHLPSSFVPPSFPAPLVLFVLYRGQRGRGR